MASGVRRLRGAFKDEESAKQFYDWANHPISRMIVAAIRDIALNGSPNVDSKDVGVNYGITLGLNTAANLMTDPSSVFPEMFANVANTSAQVLDHPDFSVSPHEALDNLGELN